ncbi:MAG: hypothetical protein ABSE28_02510 [Candidatus Sulfotelmatobacter sp.]|jgi:hypothetical protein
MTPQVSELLEKALSFPTQERGLLIDGLVESLDDEPAEEGVEAVWDGAQRTRRANESQPPYLDFISRRKRIGPTALVTSPPGLSRNSSRTLIHAPRYITTKERSGAAPLAHYLRIGAAPPFAIFEGWALD